LLREPQGLLKKNKFNLPLADLALADEKYTGERKKDIPIGLQFADLNHMVEHSARLDAVFHALSDPTTRAMLGHLAERERSIGELAMPFRMTLAGASKHVRVLEHAGLVTRMIRGRTHLCRLQAARLAEADAWLKHYERFWSNRLDTLDAILREEDRRETTKKKG
jgi:DNA-binding transcriptional ArsR family regulator